MTRKLLRVLAVLAALHVSLSGAAYWAMSQPPDTFGRIMARVPVPLMMVLPFETLWTSARAGTLHAGDAAPDFRLPRLDRQDPVQLSAFRGVRPVVLVFGSYT